MKIAVLFLSRIVGLPPSECPLGSRALRTNWEMGTSASVPGWFILVLAPYRDLEDRHSAHAREPDAGPSSIEVIHDHSEPQQPQREAEGARAGPKRRSCSQRPQQGCRPPSASWRWRWWRPQNARPRPSERGGG